MNRTLCFVLMVFFVINCFSNPNSAENVFQFADYLFSYGEYRRAATEYLRYYSLYQTEHNARRALFNAAFSLEKSTEYRNARNFYSMLNEESFSNAASYRYALTHYLEDNIDSCLLHINYHRDDLTLRYLEGFCYLRLREYSSAESLYYSLASLQSSRELSSSIHYLISKSRQGSSLQSRSPIVAGMLSTVVPGLGMGYSGRWGDALFSFMAVAVTVAPAIYFYEDDQAFAITTGLIGAFLYGGNIFGSVNSAKRYNEERHEAFYRETLDGVPLKPSEVYTRFNE